jgi:hypothetical protein
MNTTDHLSNFAGYGGYGGYGAGNRAQITFFILYLGAI